MELNISDRSELQGGARGGGILSLQDLFCEHWDVDPGVR